MDHKWRKVGRGRPLALAAALLVSAASMWAQSTAAARVIEMQGRVSIFQDNYEIPLYLGSPVQARQLVRTGPDGYAKFQLGDGSTFEVFQNSQVVFRTNPSNLGDLLDVIIGRVKVFIQHRNGPNPNRVTTQTAVISVRGTVFDVVVEDDDATTLVSVDEGIVGVRHQLLPGSEIQLQAGESFRVFRNQPLAKRIDKGGAAQKALRIAAQAVYDVMLMHPGGGGASSTPGTSTGTGTTSTGTSGDQKSPNPPPPPPPPPAAPPPPPPPPPAH